MSRRQRESIRQLTTDNGLDFNQLFQSQLCDFRLFGGGDAQLFIRIILQTSVQNCEHLIRTLAAGANYEDITKLVLVLLI